MDGGVGVGAYIVCMAWARGRLGIVLGFGSVRMLRLICEAVAEGEVQRGSC
jgi:hypothetical protein